MNRHSVLWGLLLVQLALAAWLISRGSGEPASAEPFADIAAGAVTGIEIAASASDEGSVSLRKDGNRWWLDEHPAASDRVENALAALLDVEVAWPVASSQSTAERFEVAEGNAQRRVTLSDAAGQVLGVAFMGSSPGYQRVHLRRAERPDIYAVALSHADYPNDADGWLDRSLLQPPGRIERIQFERPDGDSWELVADGDGWMVGDEVADSEKASRLSARLTGLRVTGLSALDASVVPEPFGRLLITARDGDATIEQSLSIERWGDDVVSYQVGRTDAPARYGLAAYIAEQLAVDAEAWLAEPAPQPAVDAAP